jgi:tRNA pseudouridine38-40 synthase
LVTESAPDRQEQPPADSRRFALGLEYDGTNYHGWQIQSHAPSIQDCLNRALSAVADETIECVGAGRTDSGVHATGQVAHFDSLADRGLRSWLLGINSNLPEDISVRWVRLVPEDFHARYSAVARGYRYVILNRPIRSALERSRAWWIRQPLNLASMDAAARYLLGEHDFSAFRAAACQSHSPVRSIRSLQISQTDDRIVIECEANAFLHHMVRNIVGSLVTVGRGEQEPGWLRQLLDQRDRRVAGMTAPPWALFLTMVQYPAEFDLPYID